VYCVPEQILTRTLSAMRGCGRIALLCFIAACNVDSGDAASASTVRVLTFAAIPDQNTTELATKFGPLEKYLTEALGIDTRYVALRDYQAVVEAFKNGDIHLAWFGGLTGVQARYAVPNSRAIAQGDTDPEFYSYFIANISTGLERSDTFPTAIARYRFTFGSESSTSGRLMPEFFIRKHTGLESRDFFQGVVGYSGSHDKTAELVESGQYQVGVLNYAVYEQRVRMGKTDPRKAMVIWQTPPFRDYNWTAHPDLERHFGTGFIDRLQAALIDIDDPTLLNALPRRRLIPTSNSDFDSLALIAKQLGMLR
jgi:phosphonate transport system substrate-binding protein